MKGQKVFCNGKKKKSLDFQYQKMTQKLWITIVKQSKKVELKRRDQSDNHKLPRKGGH